MRKLFACLALASLVISPAAQAKKKPRPAWQVMRATDPVTRASTCAVVASDYVGGTRFTQTGALYPIVELNSTYGLLVGVSSGGQIRLPVGDILWVVDDLPYRELKAADNPGAVPPPSAPGAEAVAELSAYAQHLARTMTATSTMASGTKAREMLDEMLRGSALLFRSAGAGPQTGLSDYQALAAGQVNRKGELKPIPLDASFQEGLRICGIV